MAGLHPKNQIQKERLLTAEHWLCMERAKFYTDVYRETEGEHPSLRAAKALTKTLENMTIAILPEELLVGNRASKHIAPPFAPEKGDFNYVFMYLFERLERFGYRISPEHKQILFDEILPYWAGKTIRDMKVEKFAENELGSELNLSPRALFRKLKNFHKSGLLKMILEEEGGASTGNGNGNNFKLGKNVSKLANILKLIGALRGGAQDNVKCRGRCIDTQAHIVVGHRNVLEYGFEGIKARAEERLETATSDDERGFLSGVMMVCDAMRLFSQRFAELAREQAARENDEGRKSELQRIAAICERVPWEPPTSFHEALQALWFTQNAVIISYGAGSGITPGRVDQLLYPYYKKDIEAGTITNDEVLRLLEEFIIKINNNVVIWPNIAGVRLNHLGSDIENITLGGVDREGNDAANALSHLFIEAIRNTKLATSSSFRISEKTAPEFFQNAVALHKDTNGPAFYNDEIAIRTLMNDGYTLEAARDYCVVGCVEPNGSGDTFGATGGSKIYLPTVLDLVFNRGKTTFFGNQDTPDHGDPLKFKTFEEFMDAYYQYLAESVAYVAQATDLRDELWATYYHNPLISCTIDGCIENAKDMTQGGAVYNFGAIGGGGLATTVDSLAAIKKFVYDEQSLSMKELMHALQTNYNASEPLRQRLRNSPKFGNDDDYVDALAVEIVDRFCELVASHKMRNGGHYKPSFISYGLNVYEGALEPATPDGRKASQPLSNSISPSNGCERQGPTAAMNSLAKIDHTKIGFGDSLNMKFPSMLLKSKKGADILDALIRGYFDKGGYHVQFNIVGADILRDAQCHPEQYEDLIVRVSGYAAYFTRLGKEIQDDIIARTEFQ